VSTRFLLKSLTLGVAAMLSAGTLTSAAVGAEQRRGTTSRETDREGCARYDVSFDDLEVARGEETVDVPRASVDRIRAETGRGGVLVVGWAGEGYRIRACKAAGGATASEAQARLGMISLQVNGGQISATRPDGEDDWVVHFIVQAPAGGAVSLEAANGPLSLRSFSGTADMVTRNGPISISRSAGHITARAVNGPVTVSDSSGEITASTQNGPVSVSLADRWEGGTLEASTRNGPLNFEIPSGYQAGVEVRMGRHSPFRCNSNACRDSASRTWTDDERTVVIGSTPPVVKLSTVNGPVTIGDRN
jgi:hypothetical protein